MSNDSAQCRHITSDMMTNIDNAIADVLSRSKFGEVRIVIEKGVPRWVIPAPSLPLEPVRVAAS